ncbi:hypothetical protein GCM10010393_16160 [Streptomyces gobitricini]|uniref:Uncharacterized protein n=1 Tax=Streptomyces gobitricini TaxID=68211 RepID=A0ABN3LN09_9ACTN
MSSEKEILYDKEITLVSEVGEVPGRLVAEFSGADYTVRIAHGSHTTAHTDWNLFAALSKVRRDLEPQGVMPALEGACLDVYPSRMALEMGGGRRAYRWSHSGRPETVDIFASVPSRDRWRLASVNEQEAANKQRRGRKNG